MEVLEINYNGEIIIRDTRQWKHLYQRRVRDNEKQRQQQWNRSIMNTVVDIWWTCNDYGGNGIYAV